MQFSIKIPKRCSFLATMCSLHSDGLYWKIYILHPSIFELICMQFHWHVSPVCPEPVKCYMNYLQLNLHFALVLFVSSGKFGQEIFFSPHCSWAFFLRIEKKLFPFKPTTTHSSIASIVFSWLILSQPTHGGNAAFRSMKNSWSSSACDSLECHSVLCVFVCARMTVASDLCTGYSIIPRAEAVLIQHWTQYDLVHF